MNVYRYCIHRIGDGEEVAVPIANASDYLADRVVAHWLATPKLARLRIPEVVIRAAVASALDDAREAARIASLRI